MSQTENRVCNQDWISVEAHRPGDGVIVLLFSTADGFIIESWEQELGFIIGSWEQELGGWYNDHGTRLSERRPVTHWMPLPEPPK